MTTEPATWWSLIQAAWPLWLALGAVLIVGTAEQWSRILDRLMSTRACRRTVGPFRSDGHVCRCALRGSGHQLPHVCRCGCQWWPIGRPGSGWRRIR